MASVAAVVMNASAFGVGAKSHRCCCCPCQKWTAAKYPDRPSPCSVNVSSSSSSRSRSLEIAPPLKFLAPASKNSSLSSSRQFESLSQPKLSASARARAGARARARARARAWPPWTGGSPIKSTFCVPATSCRIIGTYREGRQCDRDSRRRNLCTFAANSPPEDLGITVEGDPYEETESEEEARKRNWKDRGWAPWEELHTPESQFALDSLEDGEDEDPVVSWESFDRFNKQDRGRIERELDEAAEKEEAERVKSGKLEGSLWEQPLVFTVTPPRDWPPPGWKVDAKELAFIREAHTGPLARARVPAEALQESNLQPEGERFTVPRWETFLKQYHAYVAANKERLDREALEADAEYYSGRRRTGDEYREGMYELPFIYPGQHYIGIVVYVSLYEGAFVDFGGVHDGWIPIMDNDWYEIRKHINVGMTVHVEVMAKRDPYRFRFPVEMRFVDPNIDHLIFRRFKYPPIFARTEDTNLDEVARDSKRPYYPKVRPEADLDREELNEARVHPYVRRLWMVHEAEKMILEDEEGASDDDEGWEEWATQEEDDPTGEWANEPGILHEMEDGLEVPTIVLHVDEKYLDLETARSEREALKKLRAEAEAKGEQFEEPEGRFHRRVKELNDMHQQHWVEQKEALVRDRACRLEMGLPLEEPGRYADKSFWGKNPYDPREPQWRNDYWGDPNKIKDEIRKEREPRVRAATEDTAAAAVAGGAAEVEYEEEDDMFESWGADGVTGGKKTSGEEGASSGTDSGLNYDDPDVRLVLAESEEEVDGGDNRGLLNGTAAESMTTLSARDQDALEAEEQEDDFNSEAENSEGDEVAESDDEPTFDT